MGEIAGKMAGEIAIWKVSSMRPKTKRKNLKKTSGSQGYLGLKQAYFFSDSKFPKSPQCPPSVCCADLNSLEKNSL